MPQSAPAKPDASLLENSVNLRHYLHIVLERRWLAVSAFLVVRWLLQFVRHHSFTGFALCRILLGVALLWWGG